MALMSQHEINQVLAESPLFAHLRENQRLEIATSLKQEEWPRHSVVMTPSDTLDSFYVILKGRVKIVRQNPQTGREISLFLLGPGDGFNVISLLGGKPHDVTAETLDSVQVVYGPVDRWLTWLDEWPEFRDAMRRYIERQMRTLSELASDLALHDTMTRLVHLILRHFNQGDGTHAGRLNLIEDLPHSELAHLIGTVRVVVNRLLRELQQEGILDTQDGNLRVRNFEKLLTKAEDHLARENADASVNLR